MQPEQQVREVRRVTWWGMIVNIFLSAGKILAGIIGNSQAVVADGVHSLSDCTTDVAVIVGVRFWSAPPDEDHPYGHSRIETLVSLLIGLLLGGVAIGLGYEALSTIREQHPPPGVIALIAAIVSLISKEILYRWTVAVGRRIKSSAVVANAWHHRSDAFSSLPVAAAVGIAMIFPEWYFLDHIGALAVMVLILQAAGRIVMPALRELADAGAPLELRNLCEQIARETPGVEHVHKLRTRQLGFGLQVDLHVHVAPDLSVRDGHDISEDVKRRLYELGPDIVDVITHMEPCEHQNEQDPPNGGA
jgi:cation diffusion facilitator family transporter